MWRILPSVASVVVKHANDGLRTLTFAAMDTTSNALSATLWRLAQNQDIQDRVRREILAARELYGGSDIPYDDLVSLPVLDAICRETLRV